MTTTPPPSSSLFQRLRRAWERRCESGSAPWRRLRLNWYFGYKGVKHGSHLESLGKLPCIKNDGGVAIGDRVVFRSPHYRIEIHVGANACLAIGSDSYVNQGATLAAEQSIEIGERCLIGEFVAIYDTHFHPIQPDRPVKTAPVKIGSNVWLGHRAIILPGVTIGDHAVIAAGAVVTADVAEKSIVAGSPARTVRQFDCPPNWRRP